MAIQTPNIQQFILGEIDRRKRTEGLSKHYVQILKADVPSSSLSSKQSWAWDQFHKDKKKLIGEGVSLFCDSAGREAPLSSQRNNGNIIGFKRARDGMPRINVHWGDDEVIPVWLYQIEITRDNPHLTTKERKKLAIDTFSEKISKSINQEKTSLTTQYKTATRYTRNYVLKHKEYQAKKKNLKEKLDTWRDKVFKASDLDEEIKLIKNHDKVVDAYLSEGGKIIVLTKNLKAVQGEKETGLELGRFVISIGYGEHRGIAINNRDWICRGEYGSPYLNRTSTCWGINDKEVEEMHKRGKVFQLTDFIITFYSLFPHGGGTPHIDADEWLEERKRTENDSLIERKI